MENVILVPLPVPNTSVGHHGCLHPQSSLTWDLLPPPSLFSHSL